MACPSSDRVAEACQRHAVVRLTTWALRCAANGTKHCCDALTDATLRLSVEGTRGGSADPRELPAEAGCPLSDWPASCGSGHTVVFRRAASRNIPLTPTWSSM